LNRNAVHAAAGGHGLTQVTGVSADKKAAAARKLVSAYSTIGEDAPDSIKTLANADGGRSAPDLERLWSTTFIKGKQGSPVEVRSAERRTVGGYAAVFNVPSRNLGGFTEMIDPQAFNKSQADGWPEVVCRYNHSDLHVLGATYSRTLRLAKDNIGLGYEVDVPQSRGDAFEAIGRGDIRSSSFAFQCYDDEWRMNEGGNPVRMLMSTRLIDVAPVTVPAYPDATVGLRSLAAHVGAPYEEVVKRAACRELRSFFIRTDGPAAAKKPQKPPTSGRTALMDILSKRPDDPIGKSA
jgi:HK97 family phage prohead protease